MQRHNPHNQGISIMSQLRSLSANSPSRRANWRALGLSQEDMQKPKIAVVNSSSELAICYAHLDEIAEIVKEEIRAAGAVPFEVRTAAPSDFITGAAKSGSYILAGRDIIANDIEVQVEAAQTVGERIVGHEATIIRGREFLDLHLAMF